MYVYGGRLVVLQNRQSTTENVLEKTDTILEGAWRGAEAYHYLLLCQQHIYSGQVHNAMLTAYKLLEYAVFLSEDVIYSLLALTSCLNGYYGICSKAFIKLKSLKVSFFSKLIFLSFTVYIADGKLARTGEISIGNFY